MASDFTSELVKDRRNLAAWVILAGILLGVVVLGLLDNKAKQNQV
jgi:hypothetical protein